jgi:dephospho-CoA kinase
MEKIIIGLMGEIASGKGTAARYLVEKNNAKTFKFSSFLRDILGRLYLEQSRDNMQKLSTALRQNFGQTLFSTVTATDMQKDPAKIIVLDGIRRLADLEALKKLSSFKLVYMETDIKKCYERIVDRGENADDAGKTFEEFQKDHERESELEIKNLKNHADFVIDNNGSVQELYQQLDKLIS